MVMLDMFVVMVDMIVYVGHDGQVGHNTKEKVEKYRDNTFKPLEVLLETGGGQSPPPELESCAQSTVKM